MNQLGKPLGVNAELGFCNPLGNNRKTRKQELESLIFSFPLMAWFDGGSSDRSLFQNPDSAVSSAGEPVLEIFDALTFQSLAQTDSSKWATRTGRGLKFDGADFYSGDFATSFTNEISIALLFRRETGSLSSKRVFYFGENDRSKNIQVRIHMVTPFAFAIGGQMNNTNFNFYTAAEAIGQWQSMVLTYSNLTNKLRLYVNGIFREEMTAPTPLASVSNPMIELASSISNGDGAPFVGTINQAIVFSSILNDDAIKSIHQLFAFRRGD